MGKIKRTIAGKHLVKQSIERSRERLSRLVNHIGCAYPYASFSDAAAAERQVIKTLQSL
tara:strand:+ start:729 stop:905 length:177 start_codon:yes stop_codon:yes gene_type:complete